MDVLRIFISFFFTSWKHKVCNSLALLLILIIITQNAYIFKITAYYDKLSHDSLIDSTPTWKAMGFYS